MKIVMALVLSGLFSAGAPAADDATCSKPIIDLDRANAASIRVSSQEAVDAVFQRIVEQEVTVPDGERLLADLGRPGDVVSHLRWVAGNAGSDDDLRMTAYHFMVAGGGGSLTGGIAQFEVGLRDPYWGVRFYSARGLGFVPEGRRDVAGRTLTTSLSTETHEEVVRQHLDSLYLVATPALKDRLSEVKGLLRNRETIPADRGRAALVLIKALGASAAIAEFRRVSDPVGTQRALEALAHVGSTTDGGFGTDSEGREDVRSFVWENLAAEDPDTRGVAIGPVFDFSMGPDRYTDAGERQLSVNRAAWQVLHDAMERNKDHPELQSLFESRLSMFNETGELLSKRAWQERERAKKKPGANP